MKTLPFLAFAAALAAAAPALAQGAAGGGSGAAPRGPERMFSMVDRDNDGRITWAEVEAFGTERFRAADADRSGGLSPEQFRNLRGPRPEGARAEGARQPGAERAERMERARAAMFRALDANGDGQVTLAEIEPFARARFRAMDANGDGAITRDELPRWEGRRGGDRPRGEAPAAAPRG